MSTHTAPMSPSATLQLPSSVLLFTTQMAASIPPVFTTEMEILPISKLIFRCICSGVPRPQLIPTVLRFQTLKCNLMSIFRMCGSMSCSTLALQNPYPMLVSFSGIPTHDVSPMVLLCHFLAYSQVGWFFFLSKHLPSPNSGFWTRPVTIMMRREDLIASNASQDVRGKVATSPFSK